MEVGPPDPIFGLLEAFNKDPRTTKVNLTIGAYRDNQGKPYVLPVVRKVSKREGREGQRRRRRERVRERDSAGTTQVEQELQDKQLDKEYAGIMGYPAFHKAATEFALTKDSSYVKENMVSVIPVDLAHASSLLPLLTLLLLLLRLLLLPQYVSAQALGGTGSLRIIAFYLVRTCSDSPAVLHSDNTHDSTLLTGSNFLCTCKVTE